MSGNDSDLPLSPRPFPARRERGQTRITSPSRRARRDLGWGKFNTQTHFHSGFDLSGAPLMRTVIQRVRSASVTVADEVIGAIEYGLLVLVGVGPGDTETEARWLANRIAVMRIFTDDVGKFNHSLLDVNGAVLVVSQFTLYADARQRR